MIDILIPLHNNEKYIQKCIHSIKSQTYKHFNVYIIDDGSNDKSYDNALEAIENDDRFFIISRKNKGVSVTREELIKKSKSDFLMFVDSDDFLFCNDAIEKIVSVQKKEESDVIICGILKKINKKLIDNRKLDGSIDSVNSEKGLEDLLYIKYNGPTLLGTLFKRELFNNIHFRPNIIYEDTDIMYKLIDSAKKITYINIPLYVYRIKDENSIMRNSFSEKNMVLLDISKDIITYIKENHPQLEIAAIYTLNNNCLELLRLKALSKNGFNDNGKILNTMKEINPFVSKNPNARRLKIIQTKIALNNEFLFKILMYIYVKILKMY